MHKIVHKAEDRGQGNHDWLTSKYSFSFSDWYDPSRRGFGSLRVINDDTISPNSGFPMHGHHNMEIITIVTEGTVTHKDDLGNIGTVTSGDVQVMSAGTGVIHSEYNDSAHEPLSLFQIWIVPNKENVKPRYEQRSFPQNAHSLGLTHLVDPEGSSGLKIYQDAYICRGELDEAHPITYNLNLRGNGIYVFIISGSILLSDEILNSRDAIGLTHLEHVTITTSSYAKILIIEVPISLC